MQSCGLLWFLILQRQFFSSQAAPCDGNWIATQLQPWAPSVVPKAAGIASGKLGTHASTQVETPVHGKTQIVQDGGKWGGAGENSTLPVSKMFLKL